jgi:hypothetical protein
MSNLLFWYPKVQKDTLAVVMMARHLIRRRHGQDLGYRIRKRTAQLHAWCTGERCCRPSNTTPLQDPANRPRQRMLSAEDMRVSTSLHSSPWTIRHPSGRLKPVELCLFRVRPITCLLVSLSGSPDRLACCFSFGFARSPGFATPERLRDTRTHFPSSVPTWRTTSTSTRRLS